MEKYIICRLQKDQPQYAHGYRFSIWYYYDGLRVPFGKYCKTRAEVGRELSQTN